MYLSYVLSLQKACFNIFRGPTPKLLPGWEFSVEAASATLLFFETVFSRGQASFIPVVCWCWLWIPCHSPWLLRVMMTAIHHHALAAVNSNQILGWPFPPYSLFTSISKCSHQHRPFDLCDSAVLMYGFTAPPSWLILALSREYPVDYCSTFGFSASKSILSFSSLPVHLLRQPLLQSW